MADGDITLSVTLDTAKVKQQIQEVKNELKQLNGSVNDKGFQAIVDTLNVAIGKAEQLIDKMNQAGAGGGTNNTTPQIQQMQAQLESYSNQIAVASAKMQEHGVTVGQTSKKTRSNMSKIGKSIKQAFDGRTISNFLKRLGMLTLGIYSIRSLFMKLHRAMKEGLNNLVQYQSSTNATNKAMTELNTSLLYLKNAWGSAFAPIINVVMPYLTQLIDAIATVGNLIARFVGALTGQTRVLQAVKVSAGDYASSLDKSAKSAGNASKAQKKLNDRLAQFDDLNVLGKDNDNSGAGSGAGVSGGGAPSPDEMFKYVDVDKSEFGDILGFIEKLKKKIDESGIKEAFLHLWDALNRFKDSPFVKTLEKIAGILTEKAFTSVLSVLTHALNLLADILDGDLNGALKEFKGILADITFDPLIGVATVLDQILGTDIAGWLEEVKQAIKDIDLSKLEGYEQLTSAIDDLSESWENLKTALKNFWDMCDETGVLDVLKEVITFIIETGFDLLLQGIATALKLLADALQIIADILNGDFPAVLDDIKNTLADIDFAPLSTVASVLDRICGTDIKGWLDGVHEGIENVHFEDFVHSLEEGWERIKSAFWLGVGIIASIFGITDERVQKISSAIRVVIGALSNWLTSTWTKIKDSAVLIFDMLKTKVTGIFSMLVDALKPYINTIISFCNMLIGGLEKAINAFIKAINAIKVDIPNWVPEWGGKSVGFNLSPVSFQKIPKLAQGAVIPPNKEFMAVLGDQSHGTNVEAPLDTIKQAVSEVVGNNDNSEVVQLLHTLIEVVKNKNLNIGDKQIAQANARYERQQQIINGSTF